MDKANTSANLWAVFHANVEQSKLAQAKGDTATVNKLWKELVELNLQILNDNKWMFEHAQVGQDQTPVVTQKQDGLRSNQTRPSEKQTSGFGERMDVLTARIDSLNDKLAKGMDPINYIQPYVEECSQEAQNSTRQGRRQDSGRRGENDSEFKALDGSYKGDKGLNCEMSGALGDVNIIDLTFTHEIPGMPTSDDLDRLVYNADDPRKLQPKPRVTGYGCTSFHPKTFGKLIDRANVCPWWLGLRGFEKYTSQWLELDENERRRIASIEKGDMENREPQRTCSEAALSTPQHPCSCGGTCSIVEKAEKQKRLNAKDSVNEEADAKRREERFLIKHEFLTLTILATMRKLEDGVGDGIGISLREVGGLREIIALARGKRQGNDPYEPEFSIGPGEDYISFTSLETYQQLETYYEYIRRHPHLEIDSQVLDLTKNLLTLAEGQEIALRAKLLELSKHYEERVQNGEEVRTNILVYLKQLLRFAGDKNVEDDAKIAEEESELVEGESNDPTDIFISYLKFYLDRLDYMIADGSQIEVMLNFWMWQGE